MGNNTNDDTRIGTKGKDCEGIVRDESVREGMREIRRGGGISCWKKEG
jgi:hypothetical protein